MAKDVDDKLKKYQDIVVDFLNCYYAETRKGIDKNVKRRILIDRENNSFQLFSVGWRGNRYIFGTILHFDIIDGKIWIQCNNTEREIVDEFMAAGVAQHDIVLGFVSPHARHFSGFAVG